MVVLDRETGDGRPAPRFPSLLTSVSHAVRLQLGPDEVKLSSSSSEAGESEETLETEYSAEPLQNRLQLPIPAGLSGGCEQRPGVL